MRLLITIQHPANVHLFRHVIDRLESEGHAVRVAVREKDVTTELLRQYGIPYELLGRETDGLFDLAKVQLRYEYGVYRLAHRFRPDVITASGGLTASHVAALTDAQSVVFLDTETTVAPGNRLTIPFADVVCTPRSFRGKYGSKHRRYAGLHEHAYLRPERFGPDPERLQAYGVDPNERFFVLRLNAWKAHHDVNEEGFSQAGVRHLVESLSEHGEVYVSHEGRLPDELAAYRLPVPPQHVHHLLAYADLLVGEVATMTIEAALLGTPTVRLSPFAGLDDMGKFIELERAGLVRSFSEDEERQAIERAEALATDDDASRRWERNRERHLDGTIDVANYICNTLLEAGKES